MYQLSNFIDNDDIRTLAQLGPFQVIEYQRDLSVSPDSAQTAYFSSVMHVRRLPCRPERCSGQWATSTPPQGSRG